MIPEAGRIPKEWRESYLHVERSNAQLRRDLVVAFDRIDELRRKLERTRLERWVLRAAAVAESGVILWLANHLFDCIQVAHAAAALR